MSCNPAIGGIAKGHLVREIDALGGIMGRVIDRTGIQFRLLNQISRACCSITTAHRQIGLVQNRNARVLEGTPNLSLRQGKVVDLIRPDVSGWSGVGGRQATFRAKAVVIATGTFLNGLSIPVGAPMLVDALERPALIELAESLKRIGFPVGRLKTGTPPRLDGRTIDWDGF